MNKEKRFMAYLTKYALSKGFIVFAEVEQSHVESLVSEIDKFHGYHRGEGREWHRTWESAKTRVEAMREKKIKSLKMQIAKLKKMNFTDPAKEG